MAKALPEVKERGSAIFVLAASLDGMQFGVFCKVMSTPLPYASLHDLRTAIRQNQPVTFNFRGAHWTVEPHQLAQAPRTDAIVLQGWVREGPLAECWAVFRYSDMRALKILPQRFTPRPMPARFESWEPKSKGRVGAPA